jgi:hypothetical protein
MPNPATKSRRRIRDPVVSVYIEVIPFRVAWEPLIAVRGASPRFSDGDTAATENTSNSITIQNRSRYRIGSGDLRGAFRPMTTT